MDTYKTLTITSNKIFHVYNWNTISDIIKIISNKDLGIKFDAMRNIQEPQLSEGLKYRFEGLAYEIFNEETTEFKGFKFQAKFYYNRLQLTRSQYYNNIVAKNKMLRSFNLSTASIIEFDKYVIKHNNYVKPINS
ncbi:hypothetical protein I901_gp01 [Pelagibacter phage HTVC011P]|uniref:Uncharacterized protein n=1 Tax=Pelagibacter phage HTVC011P TaxID=1283078 RepID=M1HM46_9CAUD|nr:hypothetical protein I901_gp01 [Pelagibacter phage HTVC011P]AGE60533.1 hypothetical protein [Pelagibacter phage HTVC011P]